jgi:hypothetical protein
MARRTLPAAPVVRWRQCQREGVCDAGTADMGEMAITPVPRFQRVAAPRTQTPHRQRGPPVAVEGVQWEEAHATLRPQQVA